MAKVCEICGKKPIYGHNVSHAHNITNRRWNPNLQNVRAMVDGKVKHMKVCASCIKQGRVRKAAQNFFWGDYCALRVETYKEFFSTFYPVFLIPAAIPFTVDLSKSRIS